MSDESKPKQQWALKCQECGWEWPVNTMAEMFALRREYPSCEVCGSRQMLLLMKSEA